MSVDGSVLQVKQERDKPYLYTANPSPIHHKSNKIEHCLKFVDFYIERGCPERFLIEPVFGSYEPDVFFKDKSNNSICVEIQISPISFNKMQRKIEQFVSEYGKEHDSHVFVLCTNQNYSALKMPQGFKLVKQPLPKEVVFK
jgi:ribosomal protein S18